MHRKQSKSYTKTQLSCFCCRNKLGMYFMYFFVKLKKMVLDKSRILQGQTLPSAHYNFSRTLLRYKVNAEGAKCKYFSVLKRQTTLFT